MTTFWIRADGTIIHATSDPDARPPDAETSTEIAPESGEQIWDFTTGVWNPPPAPTYRELRRLDYEDELGDIGDTIDVLATEMAVRGASVTTEFETQKTKRVAIKARHPKP